MYFFLAISLIVSGLSEMIRKLCRYIEEVFRKGRFSCCSDLGSLLI